MQSTAVIIAAGLGTRMKSALPKAAHKIAGREMLAHIIRAAEQVFERITVVIGPDMPALEKIAAPHEVVVQHERLGTAHATRQAEQSFGEGPVAVFYADNPLVSVETMRALLARLNQGDAGLVLLGMTPPDPGKYGRLVLEDGYVARIVEYADANEDERAIRLCNAGGMIALGADMRDWLAEVGNANAKGEYYLTDIVAIARGQGVNVAAWDAPYEECMGVNSRAELAQAEAVFQARARAAAMAAGVGMQAPETVFPGRRHRAGRGCADRPATWCSAPAWSWNRAWTSRRSRIWKAAWCARARSSAPTPVCAPARMWAKARMSATSSSSRRRRWARARRPTILPISAMPRSARAAISAPAPSPAITTASTSTAR